jgi:hypothetical protein
MFYVLALVLMMVGRKLGWEVSKRILYPAPLAIFLIVGILWGVAVGVSISFLIGWFQPSTVMRWIMGFMLGAYVAISNFGLYAESTIPDSDLPRHLLVKTVSLVAYVVTEFATGSIRESSSAKENALHLNLASNLHNWFLLVEVVVLFIAAALVLSFLLGLVSRRFPRWRNVSAFAVANVSAYAAGFALDMCVSAAAGAIPKQNIVFPTITWTAVALVCYFLAATVARSNRAIFIPFLIQAGLASFGAVVGHVRNVFVAIPLFVIAFALSKRDRSQQDPTGKLYYQRDESTQSFRTTG